MNISECAIKAAAERLREGYPPVSDEQALAIARDILTAVLPLMGVQQTEGGFDARANLREVMAGIKANVPVDPETLAVAQAAIDRLSALPAQSGSVQCREDVAPTEKELWDNGCLTQWQLANWTDADFASHAAGVRKTLQFLFARLKPAGQAVEGSPRNAFLVNEIIEKAELMTTDKVGYLGHIIKCAETLRDRLSPAPASPQPREGEK